MNNAAHWSDCKYALVCRLIQKQIKNFGHSLDPEESKAEAMRAYLEAECEYPKVEGCYSLEQYAALKINECLEQLRQKRNLRISLESNFSLDQTFDDSNESAGHFFCGKRGDFTRTVDLWDYAERLGNEKHGVLRQMNNQYSDKEIMALCHMRPQRYYMVLQELQESFREWESI